MVHGIHIHTLTGRERRFISAIEQDRLCYSTVDYIIEEMEYVTIDYKLELQQQQTTVTTTIYMK